MISYLFNRPIAVYTLSVLVLIGAGVAFRQLPLALLPDADQGELIVDIRESNKLGIQIERELLEPLRQKLRSLPFLESVESIASEGKGELKLRLVYGADARSVLLEVNERIDDLMPSISREWSRPLARAIRSSDFAFTELALESDTFDHLTLSALAQKSIKARLEQLEGLARCELFGHSTPVISIIPNSDKMNTMGISLSDIGRILEAANHELGGLKFTKGAYQYTIALKSQVNTPLGIANLPLKRTALGRTIYLKDIAEVKRSRDEAEDLFLYGEKQGVYLALYARPDANLVTTNRQLMQLVEEIQKEVPGMQIRTLHSEVGLLELSLMNLRNSLFYGGLAVAALLFGVLGGWKRPLILSMMMPASLLLTLGGMQLLGLSLNLMSLAGLVIGLGVLVDNGIIMLDQINQLQHKGLSLSQASVKASSMMTTPLLASSLTTICVFFPLAFQEGVAGALFSDQAWTIGLSLFCSLLLALFVLPVMAISFRLISAKNRRKTLYPPEINFPVLPITLVLFALGCAASIFIPKEWIPQPPEKKVNMVIDWRQNLTPTQINENIKMLGLAHEEMPVVSWMGALPNAINSIPLIQTVCQFEEMSLAKKFAIRLKQYFPEASLTLKKPESLAAHLLPQQQTPFILHVKDRNAAPQPEVLNKFKTLLSTAFPDMKIKLPFATTEMIWEFRIQPDRIQQFGISIGETLDLLELTFGSRQISMVKEPGNQTAIRVTSESVPSLEEGLQKHFPGRPELSLSDVITYHLKSEYQVIIAGNDGPHQSIYIENMPPTNENQTKIQKLCRENVLDCVITGGWLKEKKQKTQLLIVALLAFISLYAILIAQFESFKLPLLVLSMITFGLLGGISLLWISGESFGLMAGLGLLAACGIVVNDAILKVHTANQFIAEGLNAANAIKEAGKMRFQAIFLTSFTTILATLPMIFGSNLESVLQRPFSFCLVGALLASTWASIYVLPVLMKKVMK